MSELTSVTLRRLRRRYGFARFIIHIALIILDRCRGRHHDERLVNDFRTPALTREPPNFMKDNFEDMGTIQPASQEGSVFAFGYDAPEIRTIGHAFM